MADLRHLLAIYVHAHQTGNSVPPHIDTEARATLAAEPPAPAVPDEVRVAFTELERRQENLHRFRDLRKELAAEPPAPDPREALAARPLLEAVARLGDCIGQHTVGEITTISDRAAAWLAENPPGQPVAAPTPDDFRRWWRETGLNDFGPTPEMLLIASAFAEAWAARCAQPIPQPVPVADRPWERPGWCDAEGRCWWGRCADDFFSPEWTMATLANIEEFCSDAMPQHCLPHWAIPQPPHANTTHPTPTEPPND